MNEDGILILLVLLLLLVWGRLAPDFTPFVRNMAGVLTMLVAVILFVATIRYWKVTAIVFGVVTGAFLLAEYFPKNKERHMAWREKVTFLQDFLICVGMFLILFEIIMLMA